MAERKRYIVTDAADFATKVAGKYLEPGAEVYLTDAEAEWEVKRGLIALDESVPNPVIKTARKEK